METNTLIAYAVMVTGALATLIAAYQLVKKGFFFWFLLIALGMTGVNFSYNFLNHMPLSAILEQLQPQNLAELPIQHLRQLCEAAGIGN